MISLLRVARRVAGVTIGMGDSTNDCSKCYRPIPKGDEVEAFGILYHKRCAPKRKASNPTITDFTVGFRDSISKLPPGDDSNGKSDKAKLAWAKRHLQTDSRNAVRINGHIVEGLGWEDDKPSSKTKVTSPDGEETVFENDADSFKQAFEFALKAS